MTDKFVELSGGRWVPEDCVNSLNEYEKIWPGATSAKARPEIVAAVLSAYLERDPNEDLIKVILVPVEVFGADSGYGLQDAISPWSDCNRARGHIYRRDDIGSRDPEKVITVYVPRSELAKFDMDLGEE
jgi:hypothetical protein